MHSADFLIFRRISTTRQYLVSSTSIVGKNIYYGSQWDQKLSGSWYPSKYQKIGWMDSKTAKLFNSGGAVKWAYFQKEWSIPLTANQGTGKPSVKQLFWFILAMLLFEEGNMCFWWFWSWIGNSESSSIVH